MKLKAYTLITVGVGWLALLLWMMFSNLIIRETRLGFIAIALDRLPHAISAMVFFVLWTVVFFGWLLPLVGGLRMFLHKRHPE